MEAASAQARKIDNASRGDVSALEAKEGTEEMKSDAKTCYRCGRKGRFGCDKNCQALKATCHKCHNQGHFKAMCKTKKSFSRKPKKDGSKWKEKLGKVNFVFEEDEYAFSVTEGTVNSVDGTIDISVGDVWVNNVLINSGVSCNIIDKELWEQLKKQKIKCKSTKIARKIYSYGSPTPLNTLGKFCATVKVNGCQTEAEFVVIDGNGKPLLGRKTSFELGVLKLNTNECNAGNESVLDKFPEYFKGLGKLKGYQAKIHINPDATPVAQSVRKIPLSIRKKVEEKLQELVQADVIERVEGPTPWVSPVCVVPKPSRDFRLCVDMQRDKEAVVCERYPIPTVAEVLQGLNQSTVFSNKTGP